ncbi:WYL domain-containing protein [Flammeovirga sp. SubArs3]|uniref:helix-turn-helix transcriptional regulator n=1 Tax=Flammeovirga sp. SubArs3 TaxID=2995316 RepID=UPI00248B8BB4|nr:WYL domain-containing protein [Flammeovirga sp. SubArs3]
MPINKNAQIRYNTLDRCFSNSGKRYFLEDLIEECNKALSELDPNSSGIRKRQIYDDIRFMESEAGYKVDLLKEKYGRKTYYRYKNPKFSISNQPINEKEANQLRSALTVLSRFEGLPQFEWVKELKTKLESTFVLESDVEIIGFDSNIDLVGLEYLTELFDAIYYKKVIDVKYKPFSDGEIIDFTIHPYYLKQYNNRWFLLGQDERFSTITNIALDRIEAVTLIEKNYVENLNIDFNEFFEDIIGVTRNDAPSILIEFFVEKERADYVKTKPLHGTQKLKQEDDRGSTFSIDVIPNKELETQIFSFGDALTVLSPASFREKMKERIERLFRAYK